MERVHTAVPVGKLVLLLYWPEFMGRRRNFQVPPRAISDRFRNPLHL
jgi:hypothetical protein